MVLTRRRQIGENIRAARRRAHLIQEEVAPRAGIERHTLNRIEGGHAAARLDTLVLIADAIGAPLVQLVRE
ncbi:helix-turn-helix domain-containing protein [Streptomyces sp. NBC_00273]|uniref:helix-turn-helix domain-containing protein n=1 Tax=Streptomyces sp. NBC_00273 TaxID=2903644 RepID=UPI002E2A3105|nr:helix-turn-helix transcriptional regulator [Streptomyces sp. NBC_00273]